MVEKKVPYMEVCYYCTNFCINIHTGPESKNLNTLFHTYMAESLLFMQLFLKILSGMANSVDPDQTAPKGAV